MRTLLDVLDIFVSTEGVKGVGVELASDAIEDVPAKMEIVRRSSEMEKRGEERERSKGTGSRRRRRRREEASRRAGKS